MCIYQAVSENLPVFHEFVRTYLLPVQLRHGARLAGRWETEDGSVVAIWKYNDAAAYEQLQAAVRADPASERAREHCANLPSGNALSWPCLGHCPMSAGASSEGLEPGGSGRRENCHRAKCSSKPVAQHQQAPGELFHLTVRAQYRNVSSQIVHLRRLHRPLEASPVARSERFRHDEV
jgi:hypothetical protein